MGACRLIYSAAGLRIGGEANFLRAAVNFRHAKNIGSGDFRIFYLFFYYRVDYGFSGDFPDSIIAVTWFAGRQPAVANQDFNVFDCRLFVGTGGARSVLIDFARADGWLGPPQEPVQHFLGVAGWLLDRCLDRPPLG